MIALRGLFALALCLFVGAPLLEPFSELLDPAAWSWSIDDGQRLAHLSLHTLAFTLGTVALSLPLGLGLALLLFRTSFRARRALQALLVLMLFIPLPVIVSSWQGFLGANGWLPLGMLVGAEDRPWATGWCAALWIQTLAAVPWVALITGVGLTWVEPELEEEALQNVGPWRVLAYVTLPRIRASLLAAVLFVTLQTAGDITVTDMMLIATLGEEVHTQFTLGQRSALARTLLISLPALLLVWGLVLLVLVRLEKSLPPLMPEARGLRRLDLGYGWQRFLAAALLFGVLLATLPSLVWKLGLTGYPPRWSASVAGHHLRAESILLGSELATTLGMALLTGFLTAGIALIACWLARESGWFRGLLFSVLTWAWVLPGPVVGIGLHDTILALNRVFPGGTLARWLYHGPSPLPLVWAQLIRALPAAVIFLWPLVRLIPREQFEAARLEGAKSFGEFTHVVWPLAWRGVSVTGLAMSALCLNEVSASLRVETPGWESFTKLLFDRMHYGVDNNVAALCVLLLAGVAILAFVGTIGKFMAGYINKK